MDTIGLLIIASLLSIVGAQVVLTYQVSQIKPK